MTTLGIITNRNADSHPITESLIAAALVWSGTTPVLATVTNGFTFPGCDLLVTLTTNRLLLRLVIYRAVVQAVETRVDLLFPPKPTFMVANCVSFDST